MADLLHKPLLDIEEQPRTSKKPPRAASLDVFRGLCVLLMMLVDYGGAIVPIIAHSPWNGLHLADSVMPFFLFIAGVSLALVYVGIKTKKSTKVNSDEPKNLHCSDSNLEFPEK